MPTRRDVAIGLAGAAALGATPAGAAPDPGPAWQFAMTSIDEGRLDFAAFRGKTMLVVNTASFCGYTPQYEQLEALNRELGPRGFVVVGIPSQDFGQEKDSNGAVREFCELTYGVDFPMSAIAHVRGAEAAPFYRWVRAQTGWEPRWNFFKVLIGRDGRIAGTYSSDDEPVRGRLRAAIDAQVARTA
jgi:glutathione peroxidase